MRGWIKVITDEADALAALPRWRVGGTEFAVEAVKPHSGTLLAKLAGLAVRERAMELKGAAVEVPREVLPQRRANDRDALVGLEAVNEAGVRLGRVKALFSNGAHDVAELEGERLRLVPWVDAVVKCVDLAGGRAVLVWEADW